MAVTLQDLVLVHIEGKPAFFARVEDISPDVKPRWWQVRLLVLTVPLQVCTWKLREEQINGEEFTMGGTPIRLEKVEVPETEGVEAEEPPRKAPPAKRRLAPAQPARRFEEEGEGDVPAASKAEETAPEAEEQTGDGKVIPLFDRKKE